MPGNIKKEDAQQALEEMLKSSAASASPYHAALKEYYKNNQHSQKKDIEEAAAKISGSEKPGIIISSRPCLKGHKKPGVALLMKAHEADQQDARINTENNGVSATTILEEIQDAEKKRAGAEKRRAAGFGLASGLLGVAAMGAAIAVTAVTLGAALPAACVLLAEAAVAFGFAANCHKDYKASKEVQNAGPVVAQEQDATDRLQHRRELSANIILTTGRDVPLAIADKFNNADQGKLQQMAANPSIAKPDKTGCWVRDAWKRTSMDIASADPVRGR